MEQEQKKPVDIIQELIAVHTTRIDAAERLIKSAAIKNQSTDFITELMNELSNYGDAVQSIADRENDYQQQWTENLGRLVSIDPIESKQIFNNMEESLNNMYNVILKEKNTLPESFLQIILRQQKMILSL